MMNTVGLAIFLFVTTNIDDIFVLVSFFADPKFLSRHIIIGQYIGIGALVSVSFIASLISLVFPPAYVGLLGLFPIGIGVKKLLDLRVPAEENESGDTKRSFGNIFAVAAVTMANGGDNIGVYTPVFATKTFAEIGVVAVVFVVMVALWLAFSHWLVNHRTIGAPIRYAGNYITPFVLIGIGILVLYDAGSFGLLGLPFRSTVTDTQ